MPRDPIPTWFFVLVAVRLGHRWLLVHEAKHGRRWYLPAGRVEAGETFVDAARRETLEEAGIRIDLQGVVRVEHSPCRDGTARTRVILLAHPKEQGVMPHESTRHLRHRFAVPPLRKHGLPLDAGFFPAIPRE